MAPKLPDPPPHCPRCGGRVIYDHDRKRRRPAMYCLNPDCGWTTDPLIARFRKGLEGVADNQRVHSLSVAVFLSVSILAAWAVAAVLVELSGFRVNGSSLGAFGIVAGVLGLGPPIGFLSGLK